MISSSFLSHMSIATLHKSPSISQDRLAAGNLDEMFCSYVRETLKDHWMERRNKIGSTESCANDQNLEMDNRHSIATQYKETV
jgi:hypothetical protein